MSLISDLNRIRVSANQMSMEASSETKLSPAFHRSTGTSNVAALCPAKIVQTGLVVVDEAVFLLDLKNVKNSVSASDNVNPLTPLVFS